jgi:hypothetical protein
MSSGIPSFTTLEVGVPTLFHASPLKLCVDFMGSAYSTSPYNLADLNTMLGQVNGLKSVTLCP